MMAPTSPAVNAENTKNFQLSALETKSQVEYLQASVGLEIMTVLIPKNAPSTIFWTIGRARIGSKS